MDGIEVDVGAGMDGVELACVGLGGVEAIRDAFERHGTPCLLVDVALRVCCWAMRRTKCPLMDAEKARLSSS